jgi:hypothetical protein
MTLQRRDLIKFATGGACGAMLTPIPWKILDDTATWSQNWSWIPKLPHGEVKVKFSTCTICPAGCGVRARCIGGRAVGIEGAAAHPVSRGVLCPVGFGGHTLAYHPRRIVAKPSQPVYSRIAGRIAKGDRAAILDLGPERAVSALYREAAEAFGNAVYLRLPDRQEATLNAVSEILGRSPGSLGLDLEHIRTLVSFGAPVLERWATPGRVMERWRTGGLRIVQIEPRQSRTALAAETWIPAFDTSLPDGLHIEGPAVFIGDGDDPARERIIAALNSTQGDSGIVARSPLPWKQNPAQQLGSLPDRSIDVLFIDSSRAYETVPWPMIQRKLSEGATVVALAYREDAFTAHTAVTMPVPAPFECMEDAGTPPCAAINSFSLAPPLIETAQRTALDHLNAILTAAGKPPIRTTIEDELKHRAAAILASKKGTVVSCSDGSVTNVAGMGSVDDLWKKLLAGACWIGEPSREKLPVKPVASPPVQQALISDPQWPFKLIAYSTPDEGVPLSTKLYRESGLYTPSTLARVSPETAERIGVASGTTIVIDTLYGSSRRQLLVDPAVMPGVVETTDDIVGICTDGSGSAWRIVPANVRRA